MILKIVSILLVVSGAILLTASLYHVNIICRDEEQQRSGWRLLLFLVFFFIFGYLIYATTVSMSRFAFDQFIVSLILFGGGFFVIVVARMSRTTIASIKRIAALERHNALHDELTDLPNRTLLHERIKHAILTAKRNAEPIAILVMDLDRFKEINDALGHHYGDFLLQKVAARLRRVIRESDTLARLGGDEFSVVLPSADKDQAITISKKIAGAVQAPFMVEGHSLNIGISIGIAIYPEHGLDSDILLQHADVAMYVAKPADSRYAVYDASQDQYTLNRLMLIAELREAIKKNQLVLHYQPKIVIKTGAVCGAEVLVRWQHPEHGIIPPDDFIPLAEQGGLMKPLTTLVLESALRQRLSWGNAGIDLPLSVNLSIKDLQDLDLPRQIKELLVRMELAPFDLMLEITESSMMVDPDRTYEVISNLHGLGVRLSIDDFGTGYSSLAYLKQLPASELKIDKSFVMHMIEDENDAVIVRSTIDLAKNMGLKVIAEGVENGELLETLMDLGCDMAQGNYICCPLPANDFLEWLRTAQWRSSEGLS